MTKEQCVDSDLFPLYKPLPPFMNFPNGFGYMGVILQSVKTGKIQCHLCGKLFKNVAKHLYHRHNDVNVDDYREMTGLNRTTPLVCESTSMALRESFEENKDYRVKLLRDNNKRLHSEGGKYVRRRKNLDNRVQFNNLSGTCDLQAKHAFWDEYKTLGHIPTTNEMSGHLKNLVFTRFTSYEEALKIWGISIAEIQDYNKHNKEKRYKAREAKNFFPKYEKETVIREINNFISTHKRLPTWTEALRQGLPHRSVFIRLFGTAKKSKLEELFLN